ncbi:ABC transporter permease [Streptomyces camelliae]|uniref:ABC-2 family transporter protein n=1 Tax=Streptomyces camelliae TaxID=3004093 RepID=A0ABY7PIP2_9ACTN|nr:ABC-2 family transporter protein [Streptomyces sp. HUAS 2-6]WBO69634.1 ABC-2 family transporter protein [Streptomyces sp. HUAS 2-6]
MRAFRALVGTAVQEAFMYRGRYAVSVLISLVQMSVLYSIWHAVLRHRQNPAGYTWREMQTYLLMSFLLTLVVSFGTEERVSTSIRDGSVSMELLKPVHYMTLRLSELTAALFVELLSVGLCLLAAATTVVRVVPPEARMRGALVLSLVMAVALKGALAVVTGILCFWTTNALGLLWCRQAVALLLSGAMLPLQMLPHWLRDMAYALPFQGSFHTPVVIYFGRADARQAAALIALQVLWLGVLWGAAGLLVHRGFRRLDTYGG